MRTENSLTRVPFYLRLLLLVPSLTPRAATPSSAFSLPIPPHIPVFAARSSPSRVENHGKDEIQCLRFTWQSFPRGHIPGGHGDRGGAPCPPRASGKRAGEPCGELAGRWPCRLAGEPCLGRGCQKLFCSWRRLRPYLFSDNLVTATHGRGSLFAGLVMLHLRRSQVSNCALRYCLGWFNNRLLQCSALRKGKE